MASLSSKDIPSRESRGCDVAAAHLLGLSHRPPPSPEPQLYSISHMAHDQLLCLHPYIALPGNMHHQLWHLWNPRQAVLGHSEDRHLTQLLCPKTHWPRLEGARAFRDYSKQVGEYHISKFKRNNERSKLPAGRIYHTNIWIRSCS